MREFSDAFAIDLLMICEDFRNEPTPCDSNGGMPQIPCARLAPLFWHLQLVHKCGRAEKKSDELIDDYPVALRLLVINHTTS
jgi:hypothetical protein